MPGKNLTLIGQSPDVSGSTLVSQALKHWPVVDQPKINSLSCDELLADPSQLSATRAAWVIFQHEDAALLDKVTGALYDADIPTLLTFPDEHFAAGDEYDTSVVVAPPDTPADQVHGMLRTLWSISGKVENLRAEISLLNAHHGGLCDQMDKIDEELRLAAQLQKEFLPEELPDVDGYNFSVMFRPAGYVSGDIYEVARLDEDHIGLFLGDAVGHGVPAALLTIYIKRSLHTKVIDAIYPKGYRILAPNEAIAQLNRDMCERNVGSVRFATAIYCLLNIRTRELSVARAGHPYPFLLSPNQPTRTIEPDGAMLGIFAEEEYEVETVQMAPGDRLLLYSDGFEMAFPDAAAFHDEKASIANQRYEQEFQDLLNGTMDDALNRLANKLDTQAGSLNQQDDMTIVGLEVSKDAGELVFDDFDDDDQDMHLPPAMAG